MTKPTCGGRSATNTGKKLPAAGLSAEPLSARRTARPQAQGQGRRADGRPYRNSVGTAANGATVYTLQRPTRACPSASTRACRHSVGETLTGWPTNGIESFWSMLKCAHKGVYQDQRQASAAMWTNSRAEGYRKVWAQMLRVCRDMVGLRQCIGCWPTDARDSTICSRPIAAAAKEERQSPTDGEIITMPRTSCPPGTDGVRVFTVDDGWGWIFTAVEHWNAECAPPRTACLRSAASIELCPSAVILRRPAADLHGACRAVWLDRGRRGSGAGYCGWITAPSICRTTSPTRSSSGAWQPSYGLRRRAPDQRRRRGRFNRTLKEQIIHGRIYRNIAELAGRRPRLRRTLQCPVDRRKERLPEPRSSSSGAWTSRPLMAAMIVVAQAHILRQTWSKEPGALQKVLTATRPSYFDQNI